jgi:hypothetical protein
VTGSSAPIMVATRESVHSADATASFDVVLGSASMLTAPERATGDRS